MLDDLRQADIKQRHDVAAMAVNCEQLREEDIHRIMEKVLFEFPISEVQFYIPKWVEMLPRTHKIKMEILHYIKGLLGQMLEIKDAVKGIDQPENTCMKDVRIEEIAMDTGCVRVGIQVEEKFYYEMLSELVGTAIENEYELVRMMKELSEMRRE